MACMTVFVSISINLSDTQDIGVCIVAIVTGTVTHRCSISSVMALIFIEQRLVGFV